MKKIFASFLTVLTLLGTTPVFALNEESKDLRTVVISK